MLREQRIVAEVTITLPRGETVVLPLQGQKYGKDSASCFVVKDAGDDPDITNGAEIHATVTTSATSARDVVIEGGTGIGRITKPGLAVPVGEWAINPVPRAMIEDSLREVFPVHRSPLTVHVLLSIPNGEELAKKTLNARLGIIGGLSILGTTGIVKPISAQAWTDTIDSAIDVALACGCKTVVLSTGRTSELVAQNHLHLPEESYVMMGDYVGYALTACAEKGAQETIIAGQFAKLLKIACGHKQTHVASSELDLQMLEQWLADEGLEALLPGAGSTFNTARQVLEAVDNDPRLIELVCGKVKTCAEKLVPARSVKVLLAGYDGKVLYFR